MLFILSVMLFFKIQIQHLLKLNVNSVQKIKLLKNYSNTTLVKVKSVFKFPSIQTASSNSNTTLVKVKLNKEIYAQGTEIFKYNTC